jgi:small neutral amino acid transporter SnatA (MarC family)
MSIPAPQFVVAHASPGFNSVTTHRRRDCIVALLIYAAFTMLIFIPASARSRILGSDGAACL